VTLIGGITEVMVMLAELRREAMEVDPRAAEWLGCALDDVEDAWNVLMAPRIGDRG
jgi:hypothetical protein